MKPNEAPEKIYLQENTTTDCYGEFWPEWFEARVKDSDVEYTRTDAFIEKALKWYCLDCECNDNCYANHKCFFRQEYKRYLEGNDNALPPKMGDAFKPDDDFIDNHIHKHLIRKMQDAFIEKACNYWYKHNQEMVKRYGSKATLGCSEFTVNVKNFKNYMEGK